MTLEDVSAEQVAVEEKCIEPRLSRHVQLALQRFGNSDFEQAVSEAVGDTRNLNCIKSVVSHSRYCATLYAFAPFWIHAPLAWNGKTRFLDHLFVRDSLPQVCDNLNTHTMGAFYEAFEPSRARAMVSRIEFHYTPKHGSWLNIAENELCFA